MKIRNHPSYFNTILIINCIIFIFSFSANAQKNKDIIALLDTSAFKGKPLLNNTIRLQKFFDPFRKNTEKVNGNQETVLDLPANYFNYLSEMLEQADLKEKPLSAKLKNIIGRKGKEVSGNNTIPISVVNVESLLLTEAQLASNQEAKKNNKKVDSKDYEIIEFIAAGLLQSEAFQGNLSFEIDPSTMISNLDNSIKNISIDFNEGKGFQDYEWKQQTITHQFTKAGNISIKIKLSTKKGTYITNCPIKIHFLQRPVPSYIGNVNVPSVKSGRIAAGVAGGEYAIFMGCDGILDKPIIIAEGFDPGNSVGIDKLVSYYRNNLQIFTNNGYDLVFVNYNDGRDFIENNAEVLKRVIQEINSKKVAHAEINKLSIIGASMSGLIGRWALRQMENAGQNHEVARLICLDTPHKGANSSPGVSYVAADFANRGIVSGLLEAFLYNIVPELSSIDSPAAKEQLLFQNTSMTPNVYFSLFQNALQNLGNGGYPSQCKNIAFINGSLDGGNFNRKFENNDVIVPGDKIWDSDFIFGFCFDFIDCWSNVPNQNTEVYNEDKFPIPNPIAILLCGVQFSSRSINLPYNLDRLSGGFNGVEDDYFFQFTSTTPRFSFVPTFSSVDYKGPLNNDNDYSININDWLDGNRQVRTDRQNLTPFRAIYGNNDNNQHSYFTNEGDVIQALATIEFGINPANFFSCQSCTAGSDGLAGTYFSGQDFQTQLPNTTTAPVNYYLDNGRPIVLGAVDNVSARWQGSVQVPITGNYTFNIRTDDGTRLWFDDVQRVDDWGLYAAKDHKFSVNLTAGERKNIRIEWKQGGGGYVAELYWELNGVPEIIPRCALFPTNAPTSTDCNFTVSASATPNDVGCGGASSLSAGCTGTGCGGVNYAWNGNGNNYNGSPVGATLPSSNGVVNYSLTASKNGCGNQTSSVSVTVNGCNGGGTIDRTELGIASDEEASNPGNEGESQAFDNSNFTKWLVFNSTGNIVYDFPNDDNYAINRYTITSANDDIFRDPRNWNFQGSNDGFLTWNTVDTRSNQDFPGRYQTISYDISNTTPYKQYRLNVTGNNGSNLLQIAEIQMFGSAGGAGCTPPSPPSISANTTTAPSELTASGCGGTVTWSSGSNSNPLTNAGAGTYTATCTVNNCTSGPSNSIAIVGRGGSCPSYPNAPQWFHWDNASSSLWFAHYGPTGLLYAATDANPATPPLTRQQLINSGVTPTLANCFLDGSRQRIASGLDEIEGNAEVFPNPTNGKIKISFMLKKDENVWFNIYDSQGKNLKLSDFEGKKGRNEVELDLQNYSSGAYFIDLQYNQKREVRKVMKVN